MLIQLIIILFILFVFSRLVKKIKTGEITRKEFIGWVIFWLIVMAATISPPTTDIVANFFGVERGSNLAVYISIIVIFYLIFRIMVKLAEIDKNITKIVREDAVNAREIEQLREKNENKS